MISATKFVKFLVIIPIVLALLLCGCGHRVPASHTEQAFLLDTIVSVTYYRAADRAAARGALDLCRDYELVFSRTDERSELARLNAAGTLEVSDALLTVLTASLACCEASGGCFDVTLGAVSALYDFGGKPHVPDPAELAEALSHVGWQHVHIDGRTVTIDDPDTVIDLGAAAKGFIADEMKAYLQDHGVEHAIISLGGNVLCLGRKPGGGLYQIGIRSPGDESAIAATVPVSDESVVTSGVYQRCFEADGVTYHHLLDPATGAPLRNGLASVSVVGPSSLVCDILSTACFALGPEAGMDYVNSLPDYSALFIDDAGARTISDGFPGEG